jgi:hypothetical protein
MTITLATSSSHEQPTTETTPIARAHRHIGLASLAVSVAGSAVWFGWRVGTLRWRPLGIALLATELAATAIGVVVAAALAAARHPRRRLAERRGDGSEFALAVADTVGRTRHHDLHHDVRSVVRAARRSVRRDLADYAMGAVLVDGARRLIAVVVVAACLLAGSTPFDVPGVAPLAGLASALIGMSAAHVFLSGGRIRPGDRVRWSFASLGELLGREDLDGVAPRRWVGAVATVVSLDVAVALRGMSDRWTHGLQPMDREPRVVAMLVALAFVVGALYTMATTAAPRLDNAHLVSRRMEERTARQSVLGAAVCVGLVGLVAGVLPGSVDPADHDPRRVEQIEQLDPSAVRHGAVGGG